MHAELLKLPFYSIILRYMIRRLHGSNKKNIDYLEAKTIYSYHPGIIQEASATEMVVNLLKENSMRTFITMLILLSLAATAVAEDSIGAGIRAGASAGRSGYFTEAFGDLYLNRLVSIGATLAFVSLDHDSAKSLRRDDSVPVTALFKVHAPIPILQPYAGLGAAMVFHDKRGVKGTPVALAGADLRLGPSPLYLNIEYRRQFDDKLDFLAGGVGVKF